MRPEIYTKVRRRGLKERGRKKIMPWGKKKGRNRAIIPVQTNWEEEAEGGKIGGKKKVGGKGSEENY